MPRVLAASTGHPALRAGSARGLIINWRATPPRVLSFKWSGTETMREAAARSPVSPRAPVECTTGLIQRGSRTPRVGEDVKPKV